MGDPSQELSFAQPLPLPDERGGKRQTEMRLHTRICFRAKMFVPVVGQGCPRILAGGGEHCERKTFDTAVAEKQFAENILPKENILT